MPKINDKVYCINHPDEEMRNNGDVSHPYMYQNSNGKWNCDSVALFTHTYRCAICQYIEMYSFIDADDGAVSA